MSNYYGINLTGRGLRGESQADILRRTGQYGVLPTDTDEQVMSKINAAAELAAATAEAAAGPTYPNTTAGLAATEDGEAFAVDNGDGTVTVYLNSSGVAVPQRTLATTAALAADTGAELIGYNSPFTGSIARNIYDKVSDIVSVKDFGAVGDGVTDDTAAINKALDAVGTSGGGMVYMPPGNYLVSNSNSGAAHWDNRRAIRINYNNVRLVGAGAGSTKITLADGADAHILVIGNRGTAGETAITCSDVLIQDIQIDGNRLTQSEPTDAADHWAGIYVCNVVGGPACARVGIERVYIHDVQYYAIGFQRDNFFGCWVRDAWLENTGADGLDWKMDSAMGHGNVIDNLVIRHWGLAETITATPQAALDLRQGVFANNIDVRYPGPVGRVGIRIQDGTSGGGVGPQVSCVTNFRALGNSVPGSVGLRIASRWDEASHGVVQYWSDGVSISNPENRLSFITSMDNNTCGLRLWQNASSSTEADVALIVGLNVRNNPTGVIVDSVDELTMLGCNIRGNNTGLDIRSGSTQMRMIGGSLAVNTTRPLLNSGNGTQIRNVSGFRTEGRYAENFPVGTMGIKTVVIPHNLQFTPATNSISLQIVRATNVDDYQIGLIQVDSVSSTEITAKVNVTVASANGAATAILRAFVSDLSY